MTLTRLGMTSVFALLAALLGFQSGAAHAQDATIALDIAPIDAAPMQFAAPSPPEATLFDTVLDEESMADLEALTERIEQYVEIDENGLVQLGDVTAEELGVDQRFLDDLRAAYDFSNDLIERGEFVVADDFTVSEGEGFVALGGDAVVDPIAPGLHSAGAETDADAVPDWNAYGYNSGAMFYNAYNTYYRYYSSYWNLCNTMAAYIRMPHISRNLQYFYAYNSNHLRSRCYQNTGVWYYLPYQQAAAKTTTPVTATRSATARPTTGRATTPTTRAAAATSTTGCGRATTAATSSSAASSSGAAAAGEDQRDDREERGLRPPLSLFRAIGLAQSTIGITLQARRRSPCTKTPCPSPR